MTERCCIALLFAVSLSAQSESFGAPRLSVLFDRSAGTLHPVFGIASANRVGAAIGGLPRLTQAVVAHNGGFALAVAESGKLLLIRLPNRGVVKAAELPGFDAPDAIALSPRSRSAVVVKDGASMVFTDLEEETPRRMPLAPTTPTIAVNDSATHIAFYSPDRGAVVVRTIATGSELEFSSEGVPAIQFIASTSDLLFADTAGYYLVRDGTRLLLPAAELKARPIAAAAAIDGSFYLLADASGRLLRIDAGDFTSHLFVCSCQILQVNPGNAFSRFQIAPSLFLDWDDEPRLFSVVRP